MYILVNGGTRTVQALLPHHPNLGVLMTPAGWHAAPPQGVLWAADNAAFSGFDADAFRDLLRRIRGRADCQWVTSPDVVGDAVATAALWDVWHPVIREHGLIPALVLQDGLDVGALPWDQVGAVFVGGTTKFKLGTVAAKVVAAANQRGLWSHMGRVNTVRRILYAAAIGCASVDGSSFSRFSATHLPWALRVARQRPLDLGQLAAVARPVQVFQDMQQHPRVLEDRREYSRDMLATMYSLTADEAAALHALIAAEFP